MPYGLEYRPPLCWLPVSYPCTFSAIFSLSFANSGSLNGCHWACLDCTVVFVSLSAMSIYMKSLPLPITRAWQETHWQQYHELFSNVTSVSITDKIILQYIIYINWYMCSYSKTNNSSHACVCIFTNCDFTHVIWHTWFFTVVLIQSLSFN